jgi:hypothetical protein
MTRRVSFISGVCGLLVLTLLGGAATSPAVNKRGPLPPPSLQPSAAWLSVTTGSSNASENVVPAVWAITARSNLAALAPFDNFDNLRHLSRNAVYLWAMTAGRGPRTGTFKRAEWPMRLSRFRVDHGWEGQPAPNVQQRLRWASVHGWQLDVRVYFATQHPSKQLLRVAQQELNRLLLPSLK